MPKYMIVTSHWSATKKGLTEFSDVDRTPYCYLYKGYLDLGLQLLLNYKQAYDKANGSKPIRHVFEDTIVSISELPNDVSFAQLTQFPNTYVLSDDLVKHAGD